MAETTRPIKNLSYASGSMFAPYVPIYVKHPRTEFKGWLTIRARRRKAQP